MSLLKVIRAYITGDLVVVVQGRDNRFSYFKGDNVGKRFILNSFTEIIKLNINK